MSKTERMWQSCSLPFVALDINSQPARDHEKDECQVLCFRTVMWYEHGILSFVLYIRNTVWLYILTAAWLVYYCRQRRSQEENSDWDKASRAHPPGFYWQYHWYSQCCSRFTPISDTSCECLWFTGHKNHVNSWFPRVLKRPGNFFSQIS